MPDGVPQRCACLSAHGEIAARGETRDVIFACFRALNRAGRRAAVEHRAGGAGAGAMRLHSPGLSRERNGRCTVQAARRAMEYARWDGTGTAPHAARQRPGTRRGAAPHPRSGPGTRQRGRAQGLWRGGFARCKKFACGKTCNIIRQPHFATGVRPRNHRHRPSSGAPGPGGAVVEDGTSRCANDMVPRCKRSPLCKRLRAKTLLRTGCKVCIANGAPKERKKRRLREIAAARRVHIRRHHAPRAACNGHAAPVDGRAARRFWRRLSRQILRAGLGLAARARRGRAGWGGRGCGTRMRDAEAGRGCQNDAGDAAVGRPVRRRAEMCADRVCLRLCQRRDGWAGIMPGWGCIILLVCSIHLAPAHAVLL